MPRPAEGLVLFELGEGLLVYDPTGPRVYRLNGPAWKALARCDGRTALTEVAASWPGGLPVLALALRRLAGAGLLGDPPGLPLVPVGLAPGLLPEVLLVLDLAR